MIKLTEELVREISELMGKKETQAFLEGYAGRNGFHPGLISAAATSAKRGVRRSAPMQATQLIAQELGFAKKDKRAALFGYLLKSGYIVVESKDPYKFVLEYVG
ncbi:MAG: hypothetical protein ABH814_01540 [bacterium]